jgi:uncharacterized heparinase superfamily protein
MSLIINFKQAAYWLCRTPPSQWWPHADYWLRKAYFNSLFYPLLEEELKAPERLDITPPHLWKGDKQHGENICKNQFTYMGRAVQLGTEIDWLPREVRKGWLENLHTHDWLNDLRALNKAGLGHSRRLLEDWILACSRYHPLVWQQDIVARRIINWLTHAAWILDGISSSEKDAFLYSLVDQAHYLNSSILWHRGGAPLITNLCAIVYVGLVIPGQRSVYLEAMNHLCQQLSKQILEDGTHISHSPNTQLNVLKDLISTRALLLKAKQTVPAQLNNAIEKLASALSVMRGPDGLFTRVNHSLFCTAGVIDSILKQAGDFEPCSNLKSGGFHKLEQGNTVGIFYTGAKGISDLPLFHANALSFELWHKGTPIFLNAGCYGKEQEQRTSQSYNTVLLDRSSNAEVWGKSAVGRKATQITSTPVIEAGVGLGVIANHNGYRHLNVIHERKLFLSHDGEDLRGEDTLTSKSKKKRHVTAHFHLHPDIKCHLKDVQEVELTLPNGEEALFKASGGRFYVQMAPMLDTHGNLVETHRLVLTTRWQGNSTQLKWALKFSPVAQKQKKRQTRA